MFEPFGSRDISENESESLSDDHRIRPFRGHYFGRSIAFPTVRVGHGVDFVRFDSSTDDACSEAICLPLPPALLTADLLISRFFVTSVGDQSPGKIRALRSQAAVSPGDPRTGFRRYRHGRCCAVRSLGG